MKIRMKTLMAGPDGVVAAGAIADFPKEKAELLIKGGYAEAVEAKKEEKPKEPEKKQEEPVEEKDEEKKEKGIGRFFKKSRDEKDK